ncbi:MAG TPA: CusA/CzcA family heavy metal efflux RND transporter [Burkholderiales bacterium]|nr:CusA/CzcA family heavy metal efflux RND transporter [Burkholderiales bacterium]
MIRRLVAFAIEQPLFVLLGLLLFIGSGLIAFKNLPVEAFPDLSDTQVTVITLYPGRAAEEVERQVTIPLEIVLSGIPNAIRVFSHTQFGLSFIIITFNDKANDYFARQQVIERLRTADLPEGVKPDLAALSSPISEIYRYRLRGDHLSTQDLRTLQNWVMQRQLRTVPGVADIVTFGGPNKQYEVQPNYAKLRDYKINLQQLFQALQRGSSNVGGGYVEQGRQTYLLRGIGLLRSADDIGEVVVAEKNNVAVRVKDVADVRIGSLQRQGMYGKDDEDDIITGLVLMRKGENPSEVLTAVKQKIAEIERTQLPKGVKVEPYYDRQWLIDKTLTTIFTNLMEGALLVCVVMYLFLANFRAAAIVAAVIPLSLLGTFLGLSLIGLPANLLSLGAMDFGIIVDGAVIVVEYVLYNLSKHPPGTHENRGRAILQAVVEVGRPMFFSMIIIIAAYIPIFALQRHEGRIFFPMAFSVTSALIASLLISLTLIPLLCHMFLKKGLPAGENRLMQIAKRVYEPALKWSLAHRKAVVGTAAIALISSIATAPFLGTEFLPELNEGSIWINLFLEPSVSLSEAARQTRSLREAVKSVPEVSTVISKLGRPDDGTDPKLLSMVEALVELKPESQWRPGVGKREILNEMEAALVKIPGFKPSFSQPIRDNVLENISQIDGQIVIKVFGEDLSALREQAQAVFNAISDVEGIARAFIDRQGQIPQLQIDIDRAQAARYGLNIADVQDVIEVALAGKEATQLWEGERRFSVVVRLPESERDIARLGEVPVATSSGAFIPLASVATFRQTSGAMDIARENGSRVMAIGVFIKDRDMGSVVADMQKNVSEQVKLPAGYHISWSGEFENQERAMARLSWVVPMSVLVIFLLLFDAFKSLKSAVLIIGNIPQALIGGVFALLFTGIPLSVSAAIGFIALFGQAVLNGVVMVAYFDQLREAGKETYEAVVEGAMQRLRTVLMTGLLAMLGLLPMALSTAIGSETQKPLAVVVIGGLVTATLLTLLVLPTLYLWAYENHKRTALA